MLAWAHLTAAQAAHGNYMPEVSIIMSCFNSSRWLPEAINSVLCQTFENFELILVDDGSTDSTPDILQEFQRKDDRIIVETKLHSGLPDSLNIGITMAHGDWIARLDADDMCEPTRISRQLEYVKQHPAAVLVGCGFTEIDQNGRKLISHRYPASHKALLSRLVTSRGFFPHSSAFFKKSSALAVGRYNIAFKQSEDRDFWLRMVAQGKFGCLTDRLVKVRKHDDQMSHDTTIMPQFVYGSAAAACYLLRELGRADPSREQDDSWQYFLDWVASHPASLTASARRRSWQKARAAYLAEGSRLTAVVGLAKYLTGSPQSLMLLREKLIGLSLPRTLADDWIRRASRAS